VLVVGCGESQSPEAPTAKAPDIDIHDAAEEGNVEAVKQCLAAGADVNAEGRFGRTPLLLAAQEGHKEVAELLIAKGAVVHANTDTGWTPLHGVTTKEIAELLIAKGADVNAKNDEGATPLDWADGETAALLRKHGGKSGAEDSIHVAAELGNIEAVKQHIAKGADVNAKNENESTPLFTAALNGHKEIAELLIAAGADVNAKNVGGRTPLDWAIQFREPEIADLLGKHGGKMSIELKAEGK